MQNGGPDRRCARPGFSVLHSLDVEDSAAWIVRLAERARRAAPTTRADGPRRAPRHPSAQAEVMLVVVPGISTAMARSLLAAMAVLLRPRAAAGAPLGPHRPERDAELPSYDRRAIALPALQSVAHGTQLIDGLTGEVVATTT